MAASTPSGELLDRGDAAAAVHLRARTTHQVDLAAVAEALQQRKGSAPDGTGHVGRADHGDGAWVKQAPDRIPRDPGCSTAGSSVMPVGTESRLERLLVEELTHPGFASVVRIIRDRLVQLGVEVLL